MSDEVRHIIQLVFAGWLVLTIAIVLMHCNFELKTKNQKRNEKATKKS